MKVHTHKYILIKGQYSFVHVHVSKPALFVYQIDLWTVHSIGTNCKSKPTPLKPWHIVWQCCTFILNKQKISTQQTNLDDLFDGAVGLLFDLRQWMRQKLQQDLHTLGLKGLVLRSSGTSNKQNQI